MKTIAHFFTIVFFLFGSLNIFSQGVAINTDGTAAANSAMLDVSSTSMGILIPRMDIAQRNLIDSPATGLLIYQTDNTPGFYFYDGSAWVVVGNGATSINDLNDGLSDNNSLYMGADAGNLAGSNKYSTGVGVWSLKYVTTGASNTALGTSSLMSLTEGSNNTVIGANALPAITTTSNNTVLGTNAGQSVTGGGNILIGFDVAKAQINISNRLYIENSNSASPLIYGEFDNDLLRFNSTLELANGTSASSLKFYEPSGSGTNYTRFLSQAQAADVTYTLPVADGSNGQMLKTDGSGALSWLSDSGATDINGLSDGKTGGHSVFLGNNSGTVDDGSDNWNTGIGEGVLPVNTAGSYNTVVGDRGMQSNETGWNNTAIGHKALYSNVLGNGNIAIGFEAGYNETGSNKLYIDNSNTDNPLIYGEFDNDNVTINGTLNVKGTAAINTDGSSADASAMLEVKSTDKGFLPPRMTQVQRNGITPTTGLMVYNTTTNKPNFYNGTEWMNYDGTSAEPAVGDFHQGGVVFYLDGSGGGLICAVSDQSTGTEWGCYNTGISGADGTAIGTGAQNTIDIEAGCATSGIAADICANLSLNGYDDWFLPSKDEISVMYQNRATINVTATANGGCSFCTADCYYWSSSEDSNSYAWLQGFDSDYHQYYYKYYLCYVRAVRAF